MSAPDVREGGADTDPIELTARAEACHFWFRGFRQFLEPVLGQVAAGSRHLRLIDCGCGTGHNVALLQPHGRVVAFDRILRDGAGRVPAASMVRADMTRIPFRSDTFDVATSFDVFQCLEQDEPAIAEMARIVKPGGVLVLTVAALEWLRGDHSESWDEFRRYTPATARRLVEGAGLRAERVGFLFASVFPLLYVRRRAQRLLRRWRGPRPDADIAVPPAAVNVLLTWLVGAEAMLARRLPMPIGSSLLVVARKPGG